MVSITFSAPNPYLRMKAPSRHNQKNLFFGRKPPTAVKMLDIIISDSVVSLANFVDKKLCIQVVMQHTKKYY